MIVRKVCILLTFTLLTSVALADAEGVHKYRESVMKAIGGHMGAMANSLKGQVFTENLALHAKAMSNLADITPTLFPEGSGTDKSEALPAIWENPDQFKASMDAFVKAAKAMDAAVASGNMAAIGPGLQDLGKSCKGCHDDFRKED